MFQHMQQKAPSEAAIQGPNCTALTPTAEKFRNHFRLPVAPKRLLKQLRFRTTFKTLDLG